MKILKYILALLIISVSAYAESETIELLHANTMQRVTAKDYDKNKRSDKTYLLYEGDVHLKQGDVHLYAKKIYQYDELDIVRLIGDVRIYDDSVNVTFEEGQYNSDNKDLSVITPLNILYDGRRFSAQSLFGNLDNDIYFAKGDVEIRDSSSYAYADSLKFDRDNDKAWLYGEALMSDTVNNITMRGAELEYRLDSDEFYGHKDASVYETLDDGKKRFEVFAGKMKGNMNDAWLIATDSVYVLQDSSSAWCDSLFYNDSLQTVDFYGNAHLRYKNINMFGPEMHLDFYREHLGKLTAPKDPKVTLSEKGFIGDEKEEQVEKTSNMTGKYLLLEFNDKDEPDWLDMIGMVTSDYHVFKDSVYKGMNHMTSDTIHIVFNEGDVSDLFAIFGVEGRFDPDTSYTEMDTSVFYYGDEAHYSITNDNMFIYPSADMTYGEINLRADTMKIDWETNILYAMPGKSGQLPEFVQGKDDPVYGRLFEYNLDTQRGRITRGKTNIKEGYYQGQTVLKTEDEPLYVENGIFSTCELEHPHFCVEAKHMKVIPGDRVFAQDLTLKVMDIPLLYIPSLFVSIEEGNRRSGWVIPGFQQSSYGWGLKGAGYYWAPNDYYDARILADFYDSRGIELELRQRYALKDYISGGSLTLNYWNNFLSSSPKQGFKIAVNHPQKIGRKSSLNISGNYTNDRTRYEDELDIDQKLEQQMLSKGTFQTSIGPFSLSVNASHNEDLQTGTSTTYLPQFSISKKSASIIKKKNQSQPDKWYHKFTYSISSSLSNKLTHTYDSTDTTYVYNTVDTTIQIDTLLSDNYIDAQKNKFQTTAGVRYNDKLFGFLTVSPYLNYYEDWTTLYKAPVLQNDSAMVDSNGNLILQDIEGFKRRGRFNLGASASTTLYGVFNLNIGPLKAIRHTMNASLNYVYNPDLSYNPNYVFRGYNTKGEEVKYDYFASTLLVATPSAESKTFGMSFSHNFDAKTKNKEGKEVKTTFLTLKHSINFLADSLNSSLIFATSTIKDLPGGMDLKIDAYFDPYDYRINSDGTYTRINELAVPRMTSLRMSTGFKIQGGSGKDKKDEGGIPDSNAIDISKTSPVKPAIGSDAGFSKWSINSSLSFVSNASDPLNISNSFLITTTLKANLTPKWSGSYNIKVDVLKQKITDQRLSLVRDLHCWTLSLDWRPGSYVFISLNAKSNLLKDFKMLQKKAYY